jgi:hypothetical protein
MLSRGLSSLSSEGFKPIVEGVVDCGEHLQARGEIAERLKPVIG